MEVFRSNLVKNPRLFDGLVLRRHWADSNKPGCFGYLRVEHFGKDMSDFLLGQVYYPLVKDNVKDISIFENRRRDFKVKRPEIQTLSDMV